jgi:hypothetical protein
MVVQRVWPKTPMDKIRFMSPRDALLPGDFPRIIETAF